MFKNYFKITWRYITKQKGLAFINIFGLSIGLACFSLFTLYALNELNFDRFHTHAKNIYRVYRWTDAMNGEEASGDVYMPMVLGPTLKKDFPDVKNFVRLNDAWGESFVRINNNDVRRMKLSYADPQIFSVFSFKFKYGNAATALSNLNDIVVTHSKALELFGNDNVLGKTLEIKVDGKFQPFTIRAVAEDVSSNSSVQFDLLGSFDYLVTTENGKWAVNNWYRSAYITFVELSPGSSLPNDGARLAGFRHKYYPDEEAKLKEDGFKWKGNAPPVRFGLQPLLSMHTDTKIFGGMIANVDPKTIWILLSIAAGVLLIACINFTTLAIGRSAGRSKEVGVRKVIGGSKLSLIAQFLAEAFMLAILSALLGLLLVQILLPYFNNLSGRELSFSLNQYPELLWLIAGLVLIVGLLAGSYPALVLSNFKPVEVLKTKIKVGGSNFFTKSLVTLQFVLSAGLIICTVIIMQQLHYMQSKNPGFNKENVVIVDAEGTDTKKIYPLFKNEIAKHPEIVATASAELSLGEGTGWSRSGFEYNGKHKDVYEYFIDNDYLHLMGMQLIAGRNFSSNVVADTVNSVIVNEAMVKDFGWTLENVVGQQIKGYNEKLTPVVIGVVKNFNFRPFSEAVLPQLFHQYASYQPYKFFIRTKAGKTADALTALQSSWKKVAPAYPLKYSFLDEDLNKFYKSETRWSNIVGWAGGISIFLACLGLLGLAALAVVNRTKEIGIRKVLGASLTTIISLLSRGFLKLVFIAFVIASPLAWYFMNKWLQDYPYRISIHWWVFAITGLATIVIALITVGLHTIKAALVNPVKSLRTE